MNASIRKVALVLGLAFVTLFANLNIIQLGRSTDLSSHPRNRRNAYDEEAIKRGEILAADGTLLADSARSGDERFLWERRYPEGALFGHITGYYTSPFFCGSSGLERTQNDVLSGRVPQTPDDFVDELLGRRRDGNRIQTTIVPALQQLAARRFGRQRGGAAVINTETGAVLALYGNPTYNPNVITREKLGACADAQNALEKHPARPLLSRAYQVRYPPGSTFKIVTAAAAIELDRATLRTSFPVERRLDLPDTDRTLGNFGGSSCGGSLRRAMEVSCNTAFARLALRTGEEKLAEMSSRLGMNDTLPFDLSAIPSCLKAPFSGRACDEPDLSRPFVAYSGIGQGDVRVTPLQMALVAGAVANGGYLVRPHVVAKVLDSETNEVLLETEPERIRRAFSARTAGLLRQALVSVVRQGTGRVVGFKDARRGTIGGKTGTAQTGRRGEAPHVWFVAFGPKVAVAVVVENGGDLRSEATGGRVAGPIAKALLEYAIDRRLAR